MGANNRPVSSGASAERRCCTDCFEARQGKTTRNYFIVDHQMTANAICRRNCKRGVPTSRRADRDHLPAKCNAAKQPAPSDKALNYWTDVPFCLRASVSNCRSASANWNAAFDGTFSDDVEAMRTRRRRLSRDLRLSGLDETAVRNPTVQGLGSWNLDLYLRTHHVVQNSAFLLMATSPKRDTDADPEGRTPSPHVLSGRSARRTCSAPNRITAGEFLGTIPDDRRIQDN